MTVGIVGLGHIGGSLAKAYKAAGHTVYVYNRTESTARFAELAGIADGMLDEKTIPECELILIAIFPKAAIEYMEKTAPLISKDTFVIDCCGTKRTVCEAGFALAKEYGYTYLGGHPMAGTKYSGFKSSMADLFVDQPMVIIPPEYDNIELLSKVKELLSPARFGSISVTTAERHDEIIAFTSQMAHVASSAYIKSPTALEHSGFSAGSYKDMTRVAWLNENMWTGLLLENRDNLVKELDGYISELSKFRNALSDNDPDTLCALLKEGRELKERIDGDAIDQN